jgi:hypothetical protein
MLSVQNYQMTQPKISFKQNEEKKTEAPNTFLTHAGVKTGAAVAGAGVLYNLTAGSLASSLVNRAGGFIGSMMGVEEAEQVKSELNEATDILKSAKKKYYWTIPVTMAVYAGCGALVDKFINDKRADFDKKVQGKDTKDVVKDNPDADLTRNGNVYQKSNTGKKYGAAIGVVALPVLKAINKAIKGTSHFSVKLLLVQMAAGALGGLTLGAITDHYANKGAKNFVDTKA